jgi:glutamate--cysteine ligase catalytic subunit
VRSEGLQQLQLCFAAAAARHEDGYLWGDEVEYTLVRLDREQHRATLAIDKDHVLDDLNVGGALYELALRHKVNFHPEYGRFMLEATPLEPYNGDSLGQYLSVEDNMAARRLVADIALADSSIVPITITAYPLMGVGAFTSPAATANGSASRSLFLPDEIINRHVRFPTLTANIRKRRGEKVAINIPLYQDVKTPEWDDSIPVKKDLFPEDDEAALGAALKGHIYMDSMGFGMGNSCLQVTVQAPDVHKARYLYDSWANLTPIFLSLTAAAPIFKGWLSDQDVRWNVISASVDDRTPFERDVDPLRPGNEYGGIAEEDQHRAQKIPKSRYDSIDSFLGDLSNGDPENPQYRFFDPALNDLKPVVNESVLQTLSKDPLFDPPLASHFAHLYIRDPIVIFNERIDQDNSKETDHFENIQSTNWQALRFKPPTQVATPDNKSVPGWRVEFRSMEIQITDFENAAYAVFIALLGQAILANNESFNFYIPISKIEENMKLAHKRNSTLESKFHFSKDYLSRDFSTVELSIDEIINGTATFPGLIKLVKAHLKSHYGVELSSVGPYTRLYYYLLLISKRASGEIPTIAAYIRDFVTNHREYKQDSRVNEAINFDLLTKMEILTKCEDLKELSVLFGDEIARYLYQEDKKNADVDPREAKSSGVIVKEKECECVQAIVDGITC